MKNKKGFTVVELLISFIFVTIVSISMYGLVVNYKDKSNLEGIKNDLNDFKTIVTIDIEKDIEKYFLSTIDYCKNGTNIVARCIILTFKNGTSKRLEVKEESVTESMEFDDFTYTKNYLMYGDVKYSIPDSQYVHLEGDFLLNFTTSVDDLENKMALYRINFSFRHEEIEEVFRIKLTALGNINTQYGIPSSYASYAIGDRVRVRVANNKIYWFRVIRESTDYNSNITLLYDDEPMVLTKYYNDLSQGNKFSGSLIEQTLKYETSSWVTPREIRLITAEELAYIADYCPKYKNSAVGVIALSGTGMTWLYPYSYWTMTPLNLGNNPYDTASAWYVDAGSNVYGHYVYDPFYLRPVIVTSKDQIEI